MLCTCCIRVYNHIYIYLYSIYHPFDILEVHIGISCKEVCRTFFKCFFHCRKWKAFFQKSSNASRPLQFFERRVDVQSKRNPHCNQIENLGYKSKGDAIVCFAIRLQSVSKNWLTNWFLCKMVFGKVPGASNLQIQVLVATPLAFLESLTKMYSLWRLKPNDRTEPMSEAKCAQLKFSWLWGRVLLVKHCSSLQVHTCCRWRISWSLDLCQRLRQCMEMKVQITAYRQQANTVDHR